MTAASASPDARVRSDRVRTLTLTGLAFILGLLVACLLSNRGERDTPKQSPVATVASTPMPARLWTPNIGSEVKSLIVGSEQQDDGPVEDGKGICGLPGVTADAGVPLSADPRFASRIEGARAKLIGTLSLSSDARSRAIGLLLQGIANVDAATASDATTIASLCGAEAACTEAATKASRGTVLRAASPTTEAIAREASTTRDPFVYAVAMEACRRLPASQAGTCQLIVPAQWASIDSDNAVPWLFVAGQAAERKDSAGLDDAMNHVAHARASRLYGDQVAAITEAAIPSGTNAFDAAQMRVFGWNASFIWELPPLGTAIQYCSDAQLRDSNRWQICDAVAHQMIDNGATMIERGIGIRLGARLGWPADNVAALRQERDALLRVQSIAFAEGVSEASSCRISANASRHMLSIAKLGEIGATRAAMASTGKSVAALADEIEVERATARSKAEVAKAGASAASGA